MKSALIDLDKWFYYDISNYNSGGFTFMLTRCDYDKDGKSSTNSVRLVKLSDTNKPEDIIPPIEGAISSAICCDLENYTIYNYREDGQLYFCSTLADKKVVKKQNTSFIPWGGRIIIVERQAVGIDCEDTVYECYDGHLNLMWKYLHHGYINGAANKVYKDYIEIGADDKLFFNERGVVKEVAAPQMPVEISDWYTNDEDRSFVKQVSENCAAHQALARSLFNGKEYVLHCNSTARQYIAKFDANFKLIWKNELPCCMGTYQLLYSGSIYFSIGCKTGGTFYICTVNEDGEILEQSENIVANEVYCHIVRGQLVIFYNRTDNLSRFEKKMVKDGVMIANGYCMVVNTADAQ